MKRGQFVAMDVHLDEDDRILDAGPLAECLYLRVLRFCGRSWETDGFITARQIDRLAGDLRALVDVEDPVEALVRVGLLRPDSDDPHRPGFRVRSWLDWNRSAAEIRRDREKDATRKRTARAGTNPKGVQEESGFRPGGVRTDAVGSPGGVQTPEAVAVAEAESPAAAAGPNVPPLPRSLEDATLVRGLIDRLSAAGLLVDWRLTESELTDVVTAIRRSGVDALVAYARRRNQPLSPAFSAKAWLEGWRTLPTLRLVEPSAPAVAASVCVDHPYLPPSTVCSACRSEEKAGER